MEDSLQNLWGGGGWGVNGLKGYSVVTVATMVVCLGMSVLNVHSPSCLQTQT